MLAQPGLSGIEHCFWNWTASLKFCMWTAGARPLSGAVPVFVYSRYGLLQLGGPMRNGIGAVQRPPLSLTGENILIGFIDTGVRY